MLFRSLLAALSISAIVCEEKTANGARPFVVFPVPSELPNRNDRSEQCWLRIEDVELIETITVYCFIAHDFLKVHIHEYNTKKIAEDGADVSLWSEEARHTDDRFRNRVPVYGEQKTIKDWKVTTVLDPTTHIRLYVTQKADCRLLMYSREGSSNYKVDCEKILFLINDQMNNSAVISLGKDSLVFVIALALYFIR